MKAALENVDQPRESQAGTEGGLGNRQAPPALQQSKPSRWEEGPYSETIGQALHSTISVCVPPLTLSLHASTDTLVQSLLRHLKTKEAAISDVAGQYKHTGTRYLQNLGERHAKERKEVLMRYKADCGRTAQLCKQAHDDLNRLHKSLATFTFIEHRPAAATDKLRELLADV
jgi:hypothetical protein